MAETSYHDYIRSIFPPGSGTVHSYMTAISIIDDIFLKQDIFNLGGKSLTEIKDPLIIEEIIDFIAIEEDKYRSKEKSIFDLGRSTQTSYPKKRFCTAAIRKLGEYVNHLCCIEARDLMNKSNYKDKKLSNELLKRFKINDIGTEKEVQAKRRIGQNIFRSLLLDIYDFKCCLTGIEIPEVLRASHIIPWAANPDTRLSPENGLCLSATYDAAFDKHLISFDEDYRLILSPILKELYTSEAFRTFFLNYEGMKITLPTIYQPSQEYLASHRSKLAV